MNQCPHCKRYGISDKLFAGIQGLCIECYLADAQARTDAETLLHNKMSGVETPDDIVRRLADPFYPEWFVAEVYGQLPLWEGAR